MCLIRFLFVKNFLSGNSIIAKPKTFHNYIFDHPDDVFNHLCASGGESDLSQENATALFGSELTESGNCIIIKETAIRIREHEIARKGGRYMVIYQLGWHWEHPDTLAIERPNGHFGTQVLLVQSKGRLIMG